MSTNPPPERRRKRRWHHHSPSSPETAAESAALAQREWRQMLRFVAAMLAVGAVGWFAFPHASQFTKQWLGRRQLAELRQLIKDQQWPQAAEIMRAARRWAPDDEEVIRASLAFITSASGDPSSSIRLIQQLQQTGAATPDDLAWMGTMHAQLGETSKAREIYEQLPPEARQNQHGLELHAELLSADGLFELAAEARREALQSNPDDPGNRLELDRMDLASDDPTRRAAVHERLWHSARSNQPTSIATIELLAPQPSLTVPESEELLELVEAAPTTPAKRETARLIVLAARIRVSPHLRADLIDQEILRWQDRSPAQTTPLVAWLAEQGEYARLLRMVPAKTAAIYTDLLPHYAAALRGEQKWNELNTLLTSGRIAPSYPKPQLHLWQVEAQAHLDPNPAQLRQALTSLWEESGRGDHLTLTLQVGHLAERLSQWDLAQNCYQTVAHKHPRTQPTMFAKVYQMAEYQRDGPSMLAACTRLLVLDPDSVRFQSRKLYLHFLLGIELETAQPQLQTLAQAKTASRTHLVPLLQALAAYRQGQIEPMRQALPQVSQPESLAAGERAVYAALLKLSGGDLGTVFRLVERIPPALLLPEEQVFLRKAL